MKLKLALFASLALAGANAMACYTVYDSNNRVIYQGVEAPVDMSLPLHEGLGKRFPGAHLVFDQATNCTPVALAQVSRPTTGNVPANTIRMERSGRTLSPSSTAPLFTDRETAQRANLPHTVVGADIVRVPGYAAARVDLPTFTVIPAAVEVARAPVAPNTAAMGAAPAPRQETLITELRDGSTIVQRGVNVMMAQ